MKKKKRALLLWYYCNTHQFGTKGELVYNKCVCVRVRRVCQKGSFMKQRLRPNKSKKEEVEIQLRKPQHWEPQINLS